MERKKNRVGFGVESRRGGSENQSFTDSIRVPWSTRRWCSGRLQRLRWRTEGKKEADRRGRNAERIERGGRNVARTHSRARGDGSVRVAAGIRPRSTQRDEKKAGENGETGPWGGDGVALLAAGVFTRECRLRVTRRRHQRTRTEAASPLWPTGCLRNAMPTNVEQSMAARGGDAFHGE